MGDGDGGAVGAVTTMHRRAEWGAKPSKTAPLGMAYACRGVAIHWPATETPVRDVPAALRGWQDFHMNGRGWSDIAYQVAVDQRGRLWELRGFSARSAANGTAELNAHYGAILAIVATGETPTPALLDGITEAVRIWQRVHPFAPDVVGHGDIRPGGTECPGPALRAAIRARRFTPATRPTPAPPAPTTVHPRKDADVLIVKCDGRGTAILSGPMFVGLGSPAEKAQADKLAAAGVPSLTVERYTWDELDRRSKHATLPAVK
jgi:hypothetical protein